jgi:NOL1/NOP2/fmu family ribosome biogenesis protein
MQKQQTQYELPQTKRVNKKIPADDKTVKNIAHQYLQQADDFFCVQHKGQLQAIRQSFVDSYYQLGQQLHLVRSGIRLGELNGNIFKPHYQLAWNNSLKSALPRYELDKAQAIAYLRKDLVANNTPSNKEMSLLTYQGLPLGWGKALSGRWNNYYPNHLRILKTLDDIRS